MMKAYPVDKLWCGICGYPHGSKKLKDGWVAHGITYGFNGAADVARRLLCPDHSGRNTTAEQPYLLPIVTK